jgi:hypothetical protein
MSQQPTVGRIVNYKLNEGDVAQIDANLPIHSSDVHRNAVKAGDVYPAKVVRVFDPSTSTVNLQVSLDGDCLYWATSRVEGDQPGQWAWPSRV